MLASSRQIIICLEETEGVLWECQKIIENNYWSKTLFLFHPRFRGRSENHELINLLKSRVSENKFSTYLEAIQMRPGSTVGFFFDSGGELIVGESEEFSEVSYMLMVRWFTRTKSKA